MDVGFSWETAGVNISVGGVFGVKTHHDLSLTFHRSKGAHPGNLSSNKIEAAGTGMHYLGIMCAHWKVLETLKVFVL
jgi:hypothetical protein